MEINRNSWGYSGILYGAIGTSLRGQWKGAGSFVALGEWTPVYREMMDLDSERSRTSTCISFFQEVKISIPLEKSMPRCEPWWWKMYLHNLARFGGNVGDSSSRPMGMASGHGFSQLFRRQPWSFPGKKGDEVKKGLASGNLTLWKTTVLNGKIHCFYDHLP